MNVNDGSVVCPTCGSGTLGYSAMKHAQRAERCANDLRDVIDAATKALADIDASGAYGMCDESIHDLRTTLARLASAA